MVSSPDSIDIRPIGNSKAELNTFTRIQADIWPSPSTGILPLREEMRAVLADSNPFWNRARRQLWIASRAGRPVGRIAAILDPAHLATHGEACAYFGFFDSIDDPGISKTLFDHAFAWSTLQGASHIRGPMNPNINEECGLLIDGFDLPNAVMMPHNPAWYPRLIEHAGFSKAKDLVGFDIRIDDSPTDRLARLRNLCRRRCPDVQLRPITRRSLKTDLPALKEIYNDAWEKNWSAIPMAHGEIDFLAQRLAPLIREGLVWIAESSGAAAGLLVIVPDVNPALAPLRGRLLSPALLGALPTLLGWRCPERMRLIALGVKAPFRRRGLEGWMFAEAVEAARRIGFIHCEASWVLEDNLPVHQLAALFQGRITRRYRIYDRPLPR